MLYAIIIYCRRLCERYTLCMAACRLRPVQHNAWGGIADGKTTRRRWRRALDVELAENFFRLWHKEREREIHPDIVPWKFTVAADDVTQTHNAIRRLRFHFHSQAFFSIARVHVAQAYIGNMPTIILHEDYIDMLDSMLTGTRETEWTKKKSKCRQSTLGFSVWVWLWIRNEDSRCRAR